MKAAVFDYGFAIVLGSIGAAAAISAPSYGIMEDRYTLGTGTLPFAVGWCLVVLALMSIVGTSLRRASAPSQKPQAGGEAGVSSLRRPATIFGLTVVAVALMPLVGFIPAAACLVIALMIHERIGVATSVAVGLASAAGIYLLFVRLLEVPLP